MRTARTAPAILGLALLTVAACGGIAEDASEAAPSNLGATGDTFQVAPFTKNALTNYHEFLAYAANTLQKDSDGFCHTVMDIAIAPDGKTVAFAYAPEQGRSCQMYVLDLPTGKASIISRNAKGERAVDECKKPVFSDDGRYLFFQTHSTNLAPYRTVQRWYEFTFGSLSDPVKIARYDLAAKELRVVSNQDAGKFSYYYDVSPISWVPLEHGEALAFIDMDYEAVFKKDIRTGELTRLTKPGAANPVYNEEKVQAFDIRETPQGPLVVTCDIKSWTRHPDAPFSTDGRHFFTAYMPGYKPGDPILDKEEPTPEELASAKAVRILAPRCGQGDALRLAKDDYIVFVAWRYGKPEPVGKSANSMPSVEGYHGSLIFGFDYKKRLYRLLSSDDNDEFLPPYGTRLSPHPHAGRPQISPDGTEVLFQSGHMLGTKAHSLFIKNLETGKLESIPVHDGSVSPGEGP